MATDVAGDERQHRLVSALHAGQVDFALLVTPDDVCYATGMVVPIGSGPSPFAGGPAVALVRRDGARMLVVSDREEPAARRGDPGVEVRTYAGYAWDRPLRPIDNYIDALAAAGDELGLGGKVGVEPGAIPAHVAELVSSRGALVDIAPDLARAKAIKAPDELVRLRRAAAMTALGHTAVAEAALPGRTELEVYAAARASWEAAARCLVPAMGDLLSGIERTASVLGAPTARVLEDGDPLIADLVPRIEGYWGDTCSAWAIGSGNKRLEPLLAVVRDALARGAESLRPGALAGDVDQRMRRSVASGGYAYPHHSGHGIGTGVHEYPRIVPGSEATIEAGMVVCLEPGAYDADVGGVRLEWTFLVEPTGATPLIAPPPFLDGLL